METLTIKLKDNKAKKLIQDLEDLNIIQIISSKKNKSQAKLSDLLIGSLSEEQGNDMHEELEYMRKEWERNI
ncbi:MAG TPA: hypothetical protein VIM55_05050 [Mucilaginibacter sp.]